MSAKFLEVIDTEMSGGWRINPHRHDDYHELYLVEYGRIQTTIGVERHVGETGDFIIVPRELEHANSVPPGEELKLLMFRWTGDLALLGEYSPEYSFDSGGHLSQLFHWALDLVPVRFPEEKLVLNSLVPLMLSECRRLSRGRGVNLVERIRRYIRGHIAGNVTLDDLAKIAHQSKFHFLRKFRDMTGQTPKQLLIQMRVNEALVLLRESNLTLPEIAERTGFTDASYMNFRIKKSTGKTASQTRRASGVASWASE